jgi:hypothetical protein
MARTSAALLVDPDLRGLESLVYGFQCADWRSTACPATETAPLLVKASAADIVVVAVREPYDKTLTLLRLLRSDEANRALPLLVMGPASLRSSVLGCGPIDFLPTPVFVRDVITASRILVALGAQHTHEHGREPRINGTLADFGFFSIIRVMNGLLRSGVLQVERANHRGEILFSEGDIAGAQVGSLQGLPAIHQLLLWENAKIELHLRAVARRAQFNRRFDQIMDEAERFVRDYAHSIQGIGPSSSVYEQSDAKVAGSAGSVPAEVAPVLRLFDGRRTLTDIIDESPFRVFDTVRILTRLVDVGVLTRKKTLGSPPAPTPPLQKFWETARIVGPEDGVAPAPTARPTPARVGQIENRIGEPNRRQTQRRASAETPIRGTPFVSMDAAQDSAAGAPEPAPVGATVAPAPDASKARASGTFDLRAMSDRRQAKPDRRNRPSVSIDVALQEAATSPDVTAVNDSAASAEPSTRAGRVTGTLQVPPSSDQRRPTGIPQAASTGISVKIDPGIESEAKLIAKEDSPVEPLPRSAAPAPVPAVAKAEPGRTGANPAPVVSTTTSLQGAPSPVAGRGPASAEATPAATGAAPAAAATQGDGARAARVTGTLSITPSQRTSAPKTPNKGASVQLDPVLMAELGRLEKATTPIGPPESDQPMRSEPAPIAPPTQNGAGNVAASAAAPASSSPPKAGHTARVTGTLSVSPSSRASVNTRKTPASELSVALDPAFMAEANNVDAARPRSAPVSTHGASGAAAPRTAASDAPPGKGHARATDSEGTASAVARTTPQTPDDSGASQPGKQAGRISGAFNAVERDFFAREADLYKPEAEDNFADLDEPAGRGNSKGSPRRGPSKRHA